ncbi:MAG: replicative DNA helicase [Planctomycetota bacterium]|nr:replicative DNA helicase [Planctomycetota bacterium]
MNESQGRFRKRLREERPTLRADELTRLAEAVPPHAMEAEISLLGSMILDPRVISDIINIVKTGGDFHRPAHSILFDLMIECYDKTASLDVVQLHQILIDKSLLDEVGGMDYLVHLAESVPTAANATRYARLVREKATLRELIAAAGETLRDAHQGELEVVEVLEAAEKRIFQIAEHREQQSASSLNVLLDEVMKSIENSDGSRFSGVPTGFGELDELLNGFQRGELLILAARPSMGKTAFALNIAEQMAVAGHPTAIFSLEMGKQQLVQRMLCARGRIDSQRLRRGQLRDEDYKRLMAACNDLSDAPVYIDDTPGLTLLQLRSKARRMKDRHDIGAIVIDYLQLMSAGGRVESRQLEVSEISRGVKAMAREINVPVLCLSQLNRAAEQREGHRPRMSDLRESGAIEQDADVVMMLHREEYYHKGEPDWADQNPDKAGIAEVIVAKQRNGPTGVVTLGWNAQSTRFQDLTYSTPPPGVQSADAGWSDSVGIPI